jgi:hypothetical protein
MKYLFFVFVLSGCGAWLCDNQAILRAAEEKVCGELPEDEIEPCLERVAEGYDK